MIKSIKLHNFQSHKDSYFEFNEGFNVIIGASDNGKSSIVRAIEWIRTNRPKGTGFIRKGEKKTSIIIENENGIKIGRNRTETDTGKYFVNNSEYSVMGQDVPEEILRVLNLQDINIQLQLDGHFLILDTPGNVAKVLNDITKLDKLNNGVSNLRSKKREVQKEFDEAKTLKKDIENYLSSGVTEKCEKLEELYEKINLLIVDRNAIFEEIQNLTQLKINIEELEFTKINEDKLIKVSFLLSKIGGMIEKNEALLTEITTINRLIKNIYDTNEFMERIESQLMNDKTELLSIKKKLVNCPYCGSKLTEESKRRLLE